MINITNLTKTYETAQGPFVCLDKINLSIAQGKIFGIIGKSGAGKSTLVRCINQLEHTSEGEIKVAGININTLSKKALRHARHKIGMIFQHFNLLSSKTVYQNIAMPLKLLGKNKHAIRAAIAPLLELTDLTDKQHAYPAQLSGGQKQRVAIARALANNPHLLLCDEATSALDPLTTKNILNLLQNINKKLGLTIILITHEMNVIKEICDQVAVIDQGKIIESGEVLNIFTQPQHNTTRELISNTLHLNLPKPITQNMHPTQKPNTFPIVRLTFVGQSASATFISQLSKEEQALHFNIIQANIELVRNNPIGVMFLQFFIDDATLQRVLAYAQKEGVNAEVSGYVQ